ncbi:tetratricopeptide repeat-containing glycosyltransferase family protein [Herbaspirillum rubrisubalbicans]|uniref:tetratricopeptide repeat protein n=1 Tax=Herbaspirillum rubrisubalbicans TaxID=80842 RepID=UPI0020A0D072|nr:tetratricopeptide repeat-containing glycosyltransferase family protein [Herbaspirillum rubrisubalbicans]MCP1572248.1 tetratricopeptide (TPR) repeat protein [Herbaspirillum rubrisubalbicans]
MISSDPAHLARIMGLMCEAIALRGAQQPAPALAALDQALALDPTFLPLHMQRADLLLEMNDLAGAVAAYEACLALAPDYEEARLAHRTVLAQWAASLQAALAAEHQGDPARAITLAQVCYKLDQPQQALAAIEAVLPLTRLEHQVLHANILLRLNRHEAALHCYSGSATDAATRALVAFNRADILRRMGRIDEAQAGYEEALRCHADFPEAQVGRAHMLLTRQDYAQGWLAHEARFEMADLARLGMASPSARPRWQPGEDVGGKHVLLWCEQGQGDSLQFVRYLPWVAQRAAEVTLCAPASLLPLLAPSLPQVRCVSSVEEAGPHDCQASLLSLPLLLDLPDPSQGPQPPYLYADPLHVEQWQTRLTQLGSTGPRRPRIGLVWAGRQYGAIHHSRDVPLAALLPLLDLPAEFISLQVEIPLADQALYESLAGRLPTLPLADWADTAALACALDLVISVDTAVAHLAGALGLPCFLLQRLEGEWRWGVQGAHSPWYPSLRLLRQQVRGDWSHVVQALVTACYERFAQCS